MKSFEKRWIARTLVSLWAIFWVYFAFASSVPNNKGFWWVAIPTLIALVLCGGSALVAWTKEKVGSALLMAVSLGLTVWVFGMNHTLPTRLFVVGTLILPPMVSGLLLWSLHYKPDPSESG